MAETRTQNHGVPILRLRQLFSVDSLKQEIDTTDTHEVDPDGSLCTRMPVSILLVCALVTTMCQVDHYLSDSTMFGGERADCCRANKL